jgi:hypothetical protein
MIATTAADAFVILPDRAGGYEAHVQLACGPTVSGLDLKDEAAARQWVAKHAPDAEELIRRSH